MRQKDIILRNWETDATISNCILRRIKAYVTGFVRSGNTYTANGAAEMIKEIVC
nr:ISEcp1 transposase [Escherichia coli]